MLFASKLHDCICRLCIGLQKSPGAMALVHFSIYLSTFFSGILVPGGFGKRGTEGKIAAAEWGRKMKKPYLGMMFS